MRSHYDVLGVDPGATREEIREAYRRAVRRLHPDSHTRAGAGGSAGEPTAELVAVVDAWRVLGDADRRALYDEVWRAAARRLALVTAGGAAVVPGAGAGSVANTRDRSGAGVVEGCGAGPSRGGPAGAWPVAGAVGPQAARWGGAWAASGHPTGSGARPAGAQCRSGGTSSDRAESSVRRRPRRPGECRLCGGAPAVTVDLRARRAGLLSGVFSGGPPAERGPLCRSCGLAVLRQLTDSALGGGSSTGRIGEAPAPRGLLAGVASLGWLVNVVTVLGNLSFWLRLWRLPEPVRDPAVAAPLSRPLDPGRSLWRRPGGRVAVVAAVLVTAAVLGLHLLLGVGGIPG